jgi:hypothetical protein
MKSEAGMTNDPGCHSERSRGTPSPNLSVTLRDPSTPLRSAQDDNSFHLSFVRVSSFGFCHCFSTNLAHTAYLSRLIAIEHF